MPQGPDHARILGALTIAIGALYLGVIAIVWWVVGLAAFPTSPGEAIHFQSLFGAILIAFALAGLAAVVCGIGLLQHRSWARIPTMILGALSLASIPIGTAYGIYVLWALTRDEVVASLR